MSFRDSCDGGSISDILPTLLQWAVGPCGHGAKLASAEPKETDLKFIGCPMCDPPYGDMINFAHILPSWISSHSQV